MLVWDFYTNEMIILMTNCDILYKIIFSIDAG